MNRDWADAPYCRLYATLPTDTKTAAMWRDDRQLAAYVRLLMAADLAWPMPQALPRWLDDNVLEELTKAGVIRVNGDTYEVVGLRAERAGRRSGRAAGGYARAESARRAADGTFLADAGAGDAGPDAGVAGDAGPVAGQNAGPATVQPSKPARRDETRRAKTSRVARAREGDGLDVAEAWLASRHVAVAAGTKSHTTLVQLVDAHGAPAVISAMEGLPRPLHDGAQFIYGARNALRPIPAGQATRAISTEIAEDERHRRERAATKRRTAEIQSVGDIAGSLADHGVQRPGTSS